MQNNTLKMLAMRAKNRLMNKDNDRSLTQIKIINNEDNLFIEKVRTLLQNQEMCKNPLKSLMDDNYITKLDDLNRERYLLETMEKYLKAKELVENENLKLSI